ncbi:MAG: hypothetical protein ACJ71H_01120 [Nitrososphaeraceae archaeon]
MIVLASACVNSHIIAKTTIITAAAYALSDDEYQTKQDKYCFTAAKQDDLHNTGTLSCSPTNKDCEDNREPLLDIESLEVSHCKEYQNNDQ